MWSGRLTSNDNKEIGWFKGALDQKDENEVYGSYKEYMLSM